MSLREPSFTLGIEEEYLLVDVVSRNLASDPPMKLLQDCKAALQGHSGQVSPEFMRSQIEANTRVCYSIKEARTDLSYLRATIAVCAERYGLAPIASATHPFADWQSQLHTDHERYNVIADDLQITIRRLLTNGMHVHVGIEDDDLRIVIMNEASYFLPYLIALSTSSPFWRGRNTGLKSYRVCVFDDLPRTGLPVQFSNYAEYENAIRFLTETGVIENATKLWWDLRPSARYPTLELRVTDICPFLDDAISIAALYLCICRMLYRQRDINQHSRARSSFLIQENRWRAQRYGIHEHLIDLDRHTLVPFSELIEELIELTSDDATALGCTQEIAHLRTILTRGTSADRQIDIYQQAINAGCDEEEALRDVVDSLILDTVKGCKQNALATHC